MKIRIVLLLSVAAFMASLCAPRAEAQTNTPYSMYGYGIIGDRATSIQRQMGGVGYAMRSGRQINAMNPASYAAIDTLTFLWDMGADISFLWSKEGKTREKSTGGGLDYVTMQFPLGKYMGGSIGLIPYSSVGYAFGNSVTHGTLENQGSGGINEAYLGVSGKIKGFSVGVNGYYRFGDIQNDVYSTPSNSGQSLFEHIMQVRTFSFSVGAQYGLQVDKLNTLNIGVVFSPKMNFHGKTWATVQEMKMESLPDTVAYSELSGKYQSPMTVGAGIGWVRERASRLTLEADFTFEQWSKAKFSPLYSESPVPDNHGGETYPVVFEGMKFNNRFKVAAGAEYVPRVRGNYLQRMAYRIGAYYCKDYLNIRGNNVREFGVSAGVGFHTPSEKTLINLGFEWKNRQAHPTALVSENYFNITLGINFNEVWFWQRKIK